MAGPSSLELLAETTIGEVAAQERRGDALDTKAGVLLGFAGVLVGLSVSNLHGWWAHAGTIVAGLAAFFAGWAVLPRSYPTLGLRRMRDRYLSAEEQFTRLSLLDTRIAIYLETRQILRLKAQLVVLTKTVVDVGATSGSGVELSDGIHPDRGGRSCLTLMPG